MKRGMEWYRREPIAFLGGVQGLTAREIAVYTITLDLIYQHGGELHNDAKWLSGWISDMGAAAVRTTLNSLIEKGKLVLLANGMLSQNRAKSAVKTEGKRRENAEKTEKTRDEFSADLPSVVSEINDLTPLDKIREDKSREEEKNAPLTPQRENRFAKPEIVLQTVLDPMTAKRWVTHCDERGRRPSSLQAEQQVSVLAELRKQGGNPVDAIAFAIGKGWTSLGVDYFRNNGFKLANGAPPPANVDWAGRHEVWVRDQTWAAGWGPKPGEPGCRMPKQLTREAAA